MEGLLCSQLKTVAPTHVAVKRLDGAYEAFDRAAAGFVAASASEDCLELNTICCCNQDYQLEKACSPDMMRVNSGQQPGDQSIKR